MSNWFGPDSLRELLSKEKELADTKANKDDVYNKEEVDGFIDAKADKSDTYTKTEVDDLVDTKADKTDIYTKTEVDTKVDAKADKTDTYTKTEVDTAVNSKADKADVYNKEQIDTAINAKADKTDVYTKTEVDTSVSSKADKSDVYTKTETDTALGKKANKTDVYTQSEMNTKLYGKVDKVTGKGLSTNDYTTAEKTKLAGLSNYTLPTATATKLGGVKIGDGINIKDGVISVDTSVGKVQSVNGHTGTVVLTAGDLDAYTKSEVNAAVSGKVDKEDGKTLSSNDFTDDEKTKLAGLENYTLPTASKEELGGVKIGDGLKIQNGVVSVIGGTGGTTVIPNPEGEATGTLKKIQIETDIFEIEGDGSVDWDDITNKPVTDISVVTDTIYIDSNAFDFTTDSIEVRTLKIHMYPRNDTLQLSRIEFVDDESNLFDWEGATASVNVGYSGGEGPDRLIDGNVDTKLCCSSNRTDGAIITIELPEGKVLNIGKYRKLVMYNAGDTTSYTGRMPYKFELSIKRDGDSDFEEIYSAIDENYEWTLANKQIFFEKSVVSYSNISKLTINGTELNLINPASKVPYDNTDTDILADNVQDAISELSALVPRPEQRYTDRSYYSIKNVMMESEGRYVRRNDSATDPIIIFNINRNGYAGYGVVATSADAYIAEKWEWNGYGEFAEEYTFFEDTDTPIYYVNMHGRWPRMSPVNITVDGELVLTIPGEKRFEWNTDEFNEFLEYCRNFLYNLGTKTEAKNVTYDNSESEIDAKNVQDAIDYLVEHGGGGGGSSVTPNPQDEATDKLTKLKIENNTYSVGTSNISMDVVGDKLIVGGDGSELFNIKMIEYDGTGETPTVIQFPETPKYILEISGYTRPFNNAFVRHPGFVPQEYNCGFMIYTKAGDGVQVGSYEFNFDTNQLKINGFSDIGARLNALGSKARVYYI